MFCAKCGKTIDDNATFCGFCGAPTNNATNAVMNGAPQQNAPQSDIPQPTNPTQQAAPQYGAPQYNAQPVSTGFKLNLDPKMVDIINKALMDWFIITNPNESQTYAELSVAAIKNLHEVFNRRERPRRTDPNA